MIADVASDHQAMWWITLGLGVVVMSAAILLLQLLVVFVKDIDTAVDSAWEEAGGVATQTATTWMLNDTVSLVGELRDETDRHARALTAAAGGT
ncbi:MAG: hypothetical protein ACRD12_01900 [Acidimicrobiales bacterium]